jgi:hypothetical protein
MRWGILLFLINLTTNHQELVNCWPSLSSSLISLSLPKLVHLYLLVLSAASQIRTKMRIDGWHDRTPKVCIVNSILSQRWKRLLRNERLQNAHHGRQLISVISNLISPILDQWRCAVECKVGGATVLFSVSAIFYVKVEFILWRGRKNF